MKAQSKRGTANRQRLILMFLFLLISGGKSLAAELPGLTVIGVAPDGTQSPITEYRWLLEEDKTYHVQTNESGAALSTVFDPNWDQAADGIDGGETLSVGFHQSYMPVVAKGCVGDAAWQEMAACRDVMPAEGLIAGKNYYVSVVARSGASIAGAKYVPGVGATVFVNQYPIPTAQITILIFEDNHPINNAPDMPEEDPLVNGGDMSGFRIIVEDAGGRYGASAGVQMMDAFGNPLGTTYDADGNIIGSEPLVTGPDGRLTIKNLAPGKYGIQAVPPAGQNWQQTSTIEGTKVIDAWVQADEPPYFAEFGPPGYHVFIGFVKPFNSISGGSATVQGTVVNQHMSRPPDYAFYNGGCFGHTTPWVGINDMSAGIGRGIYAAPTNADCEFTIPSLPDGSYQLVFWDNNLDLIFAFKGITIADGRCNTPNGSCNLADVPIFQWFGRQENRVFDDFNGNGIWDDDEGPSAVDQTFNLRWRDGTIYQTNVSDGAGAYAFDQIFPFFAWLVSEVDFVRFQATGLTVVVDNGGPIGPVAGPAPLDDNDLTFNRALNPQDQLNPADPVCTAYPSLCEENNLYRIEHGPVLTQGFQSFLGQTNAFLWGKRHYPDGENGGISGMVLYAVTRAENNPELAAAEVWEPGIPGVQVNLYAKGSIDPESGLPTKGDLLNTTLTDSWDNLIPIGCKWGNNAAGPYQWTPDGTTMYTTDCYDGLRNFNQARPAVFDGGYAFDAVCTASGGLEADGSCPDSNGDGFEDWLSPMPIGDYIVEIVPPPGYEILKPEDKNVDFGDEYAPAPELLPPPCVGEMHLIPDYLTLFPDEYTPAPYAGTERALCDRKLVTLSAGANAAADFFLFTEVPIAAHAYGFILDDTQNEFDPNSPQFGEKYAPPFVPITIRDWTGRVIGKTLSDQYGVYNFLAPSTITTNLPAPSGMSPNMLTTCMNDPGDDPNNPDPNHNPLYSTFCYFFQYMPGVTTYLDTPVVPVAAFTGPDQFPLDCEYGDGTPRISWVSVQGNSQGGGPYIATYEVTTGPQTGRGVFTEGEQIITLTSQGRQTVANPDYCNPAAGACPAGSDTVAKFITRDYGFGNAAGLITLGELPLIDISWSDTTITATVPADTPVSAVGGHQLSVVRANDLSSETGVTVQVGLRAGSSVHTVAPGQSIQTVINVAAPNDLILVRPGIYNEMVIMWKPVQLQGWGEGSTIINAVKAPSGKLQEWREMVDGLISGGEVDLLPGQGIGTGTPEPAQLFTEEGAGVLVLARASGTSAFDYQQLTGQNTADNRGARIANFTIKSADTGGGIAVNGYGKYIDISNNRIINNTGFYGGGIRVGHPELVTEDPDGGITYTDSHNDNISIHHNQVIFNGGLGGAGGGISMCTGADSYQITKNWVCGNFSLREGGGIAHLGRSDGIWELGSGTGNNRPWILNQIPVIENNTVIFNESFFQGQTVSGGGIFIGGGAPLAPGELSPGTGNVQVISNLVQGNSAGAGDGGGFRLARVNGKDVAANPSNTPPRNGNQGQNDPRPWYRVDLFNNMIVNNVAGLAGGGISLQDALQVNIAHNTIANNDSLATAGEAFSPGSPNQSTPQPGAGMVTRSHSAELATASTQAGSFSDPAVFADNIIWQNRQFYFWIDSESGCTPGDPSCTSTFGLCPDLSGGLACPTGNNIVFDDLAVIGTTGTLSGMTNLLTPDSWTSPGPTDDSNLFIEEYFNGNRSSIVQTEITTAIQTPAAFDEGGNFIRPRFGPLALYNDPESGNGDPGMLFGDYHIRPDSDARDAGSSTTPTTDIDGDDRTVSPDIGADEAQ